MQYGNLTNPTMRWQFNGCLKSLGYAAGQKIQTLIDNLTILAFVELDPDTFQACLEAKNNNNNNNTNDNSNYNNHYNDSNNNANDA